MGNNDFYIAGSCHVLRKSDYPLPEEFETAYENVDQVVFETDMDALMNPGNQILLLSKGTYTGDDTLDKKLSKEAYASLLNYCNDNSIPILLFHKFKPWLVTMMLLAIELEKNGITSANGLDLYFSNRAKKDGKYTIGLEDVHDHIAILSSMDEDLNESIVESFIQEAGELQVIMEGLIKSWREGDEGGIDGYLSGRLRNEYPRLYERLITDRNGTWISPLEEMIKSHKRTLVVVGVGHLAGVNSVINLLRSKGYQFEKCRN